MGITPPRSSADDIAELNRATALMEQEWPLKAGLLLVYDLLIAVPCELMEGGAKRNVRRCLQHLQQLPLAKRQQILKAAAQAGKLIDSVCMDYVNKVKAMDKAEAEKPEEKSDEHGD